MLAFFDPGERELMATLNEVIAHDPCALKDRLMEVEAERKEILRRIKDARTVIGDIKLYRDCKGQG